MAASAILKNTVSIEEWMAATKETKKHCTLKKAVPCDSTQKPTRETCFYEQLRWITVFSLFH